DDRRAGADRAPSQAARACVRARPGGRTRPGLRHPRARTGARVAGTPRAGTASRAAVSPVMPLERFRYIAIEGPIGAGKTSLAKRLAERLGGTTLLEQPDANPFLPRFYLDRVRYALPAQLFFLFQRIDQLRTAAQPDLFTRLTIADFLLEKDPLFAGLTLSGDELALYRRIYDT